MKTINRRLNGNVQHGKEKEYCSVLTTDEELQLVKHVKNCNRTLQGIGRAELTKLIIHVLKVRQYARRRLHGRQIPLLTKAATNAIDKGCLGQSFWKRWNSVHTSLTQKRQGNVNLN